MGAVCVRPSAPCHRRGSPPSRVNLDVDHGESGPQCTHASASSVLDPSTPPQSGSYSRQESTHWRDLHDTLFPNRTLDSILDQEELRNCLYGLKTMQQSITRFIYSLYRDPALKTMHQSKTRYMSPFYEDPGQLIAEIIKDDIARTIWRTSNTNRKLDSNLWQSPAAFYRTSLHEHHHFFPTTRHSLLGKYAMQSRSAYFLLKPVQDCWFLSCINVHIYLAYGIIPLLCETVPGF